MADTEYISKEAALACFGDWIDRYGHEHTADEMVEYQKIEELPAADVREVVRGKWMWIEDNAYHVCSNCAGVMNYDPEKGFFIFNTLPNFCPNCGADMTPPSNGEK